MGLREEPYTNKQRGNMKKPWTDAHLDRRPRKEMALITLGT